MSNVKITFDAATLADAVTKASRVAPSKGAAYDKAAGLCFDVDTDHGFAILKATDLDTTYVQKLSGTDATGGSRTWRIPSAMLSSLLASLPLGAGNVVTFIDTGDSAIRIKSGSVIVRMAMLDQPFPVIESFDPTGFSEAHDFAQKVERVSWAIAKDNSIFSGVHVDGESIIACDRASAALIPCKVPVSRPITVPLFNLAAILRQASDVRLGATDKRLLIQLDAETQAQSNIFEGAYPDIKKLRRDDWTEEATLPRQAFLDAVNRLMVIGRQDRMPSMKLSFGTGLVQTVTLDLTVDTGRIQDRVDCDGGFADFEIWFTPAYLASALEASKTEKVLLRWVPLDPLKPVCLTDGTGYEVLITPRKAS